MEYWDENSVLCVCVEPHLNTIMAEEESGISCNGHLQTRGPGPQRRHPDEQREGATLTVPIALTKHICKTHRQNQLQQRVTHMNTELTEHK